MEYEEEMEIAGMDPVKANALGFKAGLKVGVRRFAWWKDGVQYVGTTGKTLAEALAEIEQDCSGVAS